MGDHQELKEEIKKLKKAVYRGDLVSAEGYHKKLKRILKSSDPQIYLKVLPGLLETAIVNGHPQLVEYLLKEEEYCIDYGVYITNSEGKLPIQLAEENNLLDVVQLLKYFDSNHLHIRLLRRAVLEGSFETVRYLLSAGVEVSCNLQEQTPLSIAVQKNDSEMTKLLVETQRITNEDLNVNLIYSVENNLQEDLIKFLIIHGADVNSKNQQGLPLLHIAINQNRIELGKILCAFGAQLLEDPPESILAQGWDFLQTFKKKLAKIQDIFKAIEEGDLEGLKFLIEAQDGSVITDIHLFSNGGKHALATAVSRGHQDIVQYLIAIGADVCRLEQNETSSMIAASQESLELCKYLLAEGAHLTMTSTFFVALKRGIIPILDFFIAKGININIFGKNGNTPLIESILCKNLDLIVYLVQKGADIEAANKFGQRPLDFAVDTGFVDAIKFLLEKGISADYVLPNGRNLLCHFIQIGDVEMVQFLLGKEANVNKCTADGIYPIDLAVGSCNQHVVNLLLEQNTDFSKISVESFANYIEIGCVDSLKKFLRNGVNINMKIVGDSLLNKFITNFSMVEFLIQNGADVNQANRNGMPPLVQALEMHNVKLFKMLADCGRADLNIKNWNGLTLIQLAARKHNFPIVDYLIGKGVDFGNARKEFEEFAKVNHDFAIYFEEILRIAHACFD